MFRQWGGGLLIGGRCVSGCRGDFAGMGVLACGVPKAG